MTTILLIILAALATPHRALAMMDGVTLCMSGPAVEHPGRCGDIWCQQFDFDSDGDVDLKDYANMQRWRRCCKR